MTMGLLRSLGIKLIAACVLVQMVTLGLLLGSNGRTMADQLIVGLLAITLSTIPFAALGLWLTRRLRQVANASEAFARGDMTARVKARSDGDEIGRLGAEFNAMADGLRNRFEGLRSFSEIAALPHGDAATRLTAALELGARHLGLPLGIVSHVDGTVYTVRHHLAPPEAALDDGAEFQLGQTCCAMTLERNDVVAMAHMGLSPQAGHLCDQAFQMEAYIGAPVTVGGQVYGTVNFSAPQPRPNGFDTGDIEFMRLLARWVGSVLERDLAERALLDARDEAEQARRRAEAANSAKSASVANMSQEIRTPMNAVLGLAYLLGRSPLQPQQRDYVDKITASGQSLLGILNNILDFSKIEADHLTLEAVAFSLNEVLGRLTTVMSVNAAIKEIKLVVSAAPDVPRRLIGDQHRLEQVLINLTGNAVKFTQRGEVTVQVERVAEDGDRVVLRFAIRDTGIGMSLDHQARLFAPFTQADASTTRHHGGSGLGLTISKRLVELMGGGIGVRSTPGAGSEFWFLLPVTVAADQNQPPDAVIDGQTRQPRAVATVRLPGARILLVEDNPVNQEVARNILELEGATVGVAGDGLAALERLRRERDAFDVVLMDVQMPILDGYQATRRIRDELGLDRLPIVALTAGVFAAERDRAQDAGMNGFIAKPFDVDELVGTVSGLLGRHTAPPAPSAAPAAPGAAFAAVIPGIEMRQAAMRLGGNERLFTSLLGQLVEQFADAVAKVRDELARGDRDQAARRLHSLRGATGNLAAIKVARLASAAEAAIRDGKSSDAPLAELDSGMTRLVEAIRAHLPRSADPLGEAAPLDDQRLADLMSRLSRRDLEALPLFESLRPAVRARFGNEREQRLSSLMTGLRFQDALTLLADDTEGRDQPVETP